MDDQPETGFWTNLGKLFRGKEEPSIEELILEAEEDGELNVREVTMLLNVLRLGRKQVQEVMVPRTDIVCAEESESVDEVCRLIISDGHSRIPIYRDNKDNIVGIVHAKDLLKVLRDPEGDKPTLADIMRRPLFISETKSVRDMLQIFQSRKKHLAIALDEYGGTSGLITFEDVLEEIVGEIEDEHDTPKPDDIRPLDKGAYLVSGRTELEELKPYLDFGVNLETSEVETIGGYISEYAGRIPLTGETLSVGGFSVLVKEADAKHIAWLVIKPEDKAAPNA